MKAQRLHRTAPVEEHPLELEDVPVPAPGRGEVLLRVLCCGVCRTDLHVIEGDLPEPRLPLVPGHMVTAVVEDIGPGAADAAAWVRPGVPVGLAWLSGTCGSCTYCAEGRENLCENARFTGYRVDGGYAEYVVAPADWLHPLPPGPDPAEVAPLLCAGIIGYRALETCGLRGGQRLGLVGFGNSAHLVLQLAVARGLEVHVASRADRHRGLAEELGARRVGGVDELEPASLHAAILFAPAGSLVPPTLRALRRGGTLVCAGIHMSPIPTIDYDAELFGERVLRSVTANTRADARGLLEEAARVGVRPRVERFPLERANEALERLKHDRIRGSAVLEISPPPRP